VVDALTGSYTFSCPTHGSAAVRLSAFRVIERLPGSAHPAVYSVRFSCRCGDEHVGLLSHDALDWAPLGLGAGGTFVNLMTARRDDLAGELVALATERIGRGEWPWSFYCYLEERPRPVTPSAFALLSPGDGALKVGKPPLGVAVSCPVCGAVSIDLVSRAHVDVPFCHDRSIAVVEHVFAADALRTLEQFAVELHSATFDERRLELEP
jgi:hypothetical protein